jgi:hypothetical protein
MRIHFDKQMNIAYITLEGKLTSETMPEALDEVVAHPDYITGMTRLWDLQGTDMVDFQQDAIKEAARHSTKYPKEITNVKVAFVALKDLQYGLSRIFVAVCEVDTEIMVFRNIEEAEAWLIAPG